jgi:1-acyl-sn-glycerol-3-phosphate acyltransferase
VAQQRQNQRKSSRRSQGGGSGNGRKRSASASNGRARSGSGGGRSSSGRGRSSASARGRSTASGRGQSGASDGAGSTKRDGARADGGQRKSQAAQSGTQSQAHSDGSSQRSGGGKSSSDSSSGLSGLVARRAGDWSLDSMDPDFARSQRHLWNFVQDHYFRMEAEGWHRLPDPPTLIVGTHAAGIFPVEAWMFGLHWNRRFGDKRIAHGTAHDALMATPLVGAYFRKMGVMSASPETVSAALEAGRDVVVYPGGDVDSLRPWTQRDEVMLAGRRGFVKQAIKAGVPIVPLASSGGADTMFTLPGGKGVARALGLNRLARIESLPLAVGLPWGIAPGMLPFFPLPAKLRVELLDPLFIDDDPERVDDDEYVDTIYSEVEWRLKQGMDRLGRRRSFPIFG